MDVKGCRQSIGLSPSSRSAAAAAAARRHRAATRRLDALAQRYALAAAGATVAIAVAAYGAWQTWWLCGIALTALVTVTAARPAADDPARAAEGNGGQRKLWENSAQSTSGTGV
ncbi:hypothetical protein [Azospirillum sp. ST 5-10]|uniref:hypothetical protein n=1 Tax=unclassified Azospirillum TaxID=2630922 RepID=UPI003F49EC4F